MNLIKSCYFLSLLALLSTSVQAAECSHLWKAELATGPGVTRGMSGDTNAAYALLSFRPDPTLSLILEGAYPAARFFSFESYKSRLLNKEGAILDYQIARIDGAASPFASGMRATAGLYQIEASVDGPKFSTTRNFLMLPGSLIQPQAIMMRIYDPQYPLTPADLPRVYAVDARTGGPRACPSRVDIPFRFDGPQIIGALAPYNRHLNFGIKAGVSGQNSAVPGYAFVLTQMHPLSGAFIRFRTPRARYFSLCVQDFLDNTTLGCLSDRQMRADANGFTYVVVSEYSWLLNRAMESGWNPLHFKRSERQRIIGFVYRQILPSAAEPYVDDFLPVGIVCSDQELLAGVCPR